MANKRQQKRFIFRCETEFSANDATYRGIASDFSLNGIFVRTTHPLVPDTIIDMTVYLPEGMTSKLTGKVKRALKPSIGRVVGTPVRAFKHGMGIEIIKKDINYLNFIRSLLG
ncbi:MAG: PilZ domain-containing protein [Nitrospirota bacterium]